MVEMVLALMGPVASVFFLAWLWQLYSEDASWVDVLWAGCIGLIVVYVFFDQGQYSSRHICLLLMGLFWSLRLSGYLALRIWRSGSEDSRYQTMRASMAGYAACGFLLFYQVQALFVCVFATPIVIALLTPRVVFNLWDGVGLSVYVLALMGEGLADWQLMQFKSQPNHQDKTCEQGLWYYSRHPNYFFEWLHWFAYAFFSYGSQYFWLSCLMPWVMLIFLLKLTGIPHVEREALRRKPDYRAYQQRTSMFVPWWKLG